jgi:hypothetical protein
MNFWGNAAAWVTSLNDVSEVIIVLFACLGAVIALICALALFFTFLAFISGVEFISVKRYFKKWNN